MTQPLTPTELDEAKSQFDMVITHQCEKYGHEITLCLDEPEVATVTEFMNQCIAGTAIDRSFVDEETGRIEATLLVVEPACAQAFLDGIEELS